MFIIYFTIYSYIDDIYDLLPLDKEPEILHDSLANRFYQVNVYFIFKFNDYINAIGLLYLFYSLTFYSQSKSELVSLNSLNRLVSYTPRTLNTGEIS